MLTKWKGVKDFQPGETQWYAAKTELGFRRGAFSFGVGRRIYSVSNFTKDFSEYRYRTKNKIALPQDRPLDVQVAINHFEGDALTLGYSKRFGAFNLSVGLSYLQGYKVTDGELAGEAVVSGGQTQLFGDVDYVYSKRSLFNRKVSAPEGDGASLDIALDYRISPRWRGALEINNALSHVRWANAPYTQATANSDSRHEDADGNVTYDPVISGIESNEDRSQTLPVQYLASLRYQWHSEWSARAQLHKFSKDYEPALGLEHRDDWPWVGRVIWHTQYWSSLKVWELGVRKGAFTWALSADDYNFEKAKTLRMNLGFALSF